MKPLTSPLTATAGVLVVMAVIAIPLRKLTSAAPVAPAPPVEAAETNGVPAWITLKLLAPAESVSLKTASGQLLWELPATPAGDVETQTTLPLDAGSLDLVLAADFGDAPAETAVFLTLTPDGLEEITRHAIGSGLIEQPLRFTWHSH